MIEVDDFYDFLFEAPGSVSPEPVSAFRAPEAVPVREETASPQPAAASKRARRRSGLGLRIVVLALICSLLGGAVGAGAMWLAKPTGNAPAAQSSTAAALVSSRETESLSLVSVDNTKLLSAAEVYRKNVDATVGITTEIVTRNYFGYSTAAAAGSGFVLTDNGYILTNYHVVEGASSITVTMYDGTAYDAALIGYDAENDVAVLKIEAEGLQTVVLGDSDKLSVGDTVLAIGNPLGELTFSLTSGVVSALDREVTLSKGTMNLIQTDCAINSGNSGGALFNLYGEVVGVTNAKYSSSGFGEASIDNIGFAIPINSVMEIAQGIMDQGYETRPYIGVSIVDVDASGSTPAGAQIVVVVSGSPAQKAGLQEGDLIAAVNGEAVTGGAALSEKIAAATVGQALTLRVYRDGSVLEIPVTVGEKPQSVRS